MLLRAAPHIIWPLRFVLPHMKGQRPAWMIRLGLFLYDHLGGRDLLPGCQGIDLHRHVAGQCLDGRLKKAFVYSDCWVQDNRLVVLNAMDAAAKGADIRSRTECRSARRDGEHWALTLGDQQSGAETTARARLLINAGGPWAGQLLGATIGVNRVENLRLVKGSHIVVRRLFDHPFAYIFQNPDGRIVFAIPYEQDFTLIGTTDVDYEGDPGAVAISEGEVSYLCDAINAYLGKPISASDVVWTYAGVRPLHGEENGNASSVTRDYRLDLETPHGQAPLLNIFGGKLTTYRKLAEHAIEKIETAIGAKGPAWTASAALPGGNIENADFDGYLADLKQRHAWLPEDIAWRYARNYGTLSEEIIGDADSLQALGAPIGDGLYAAEVDYLVRREWARTSEDILWRRSKMGLHVTPETKQRLAEYLSRGRVEDAVGTAGKVSAQ